MLSRISAFKGLAVVAIVLSVGPLLADKLSSLREDHSPVGFRLQEVSKQIGLEFQHSGPQVHYAYDNIAPYLAAIGSGVAVADYDNDGFQDLFVYHSADERGTLYHNKGDGTFEDKSQMISWTPSKVPYPLTRAIFIDVNNDGFKDLLLYSFCPRLFMNEKGRGFREYQSEPFGCGFTFGGLTALDLDGDGYLDLVFNPYMNKDIFINFVDHEVFPENFVQSKRGVPIKVFQNKGNGTFESCDQCYGLGHKSWGHSIGLWDYDLKGTPTFIFANDYNVETFYRPETPGKWKNISDNLSFNSHSRNGMSVEIGDIANDGNPYAYVSHIFFRGQKSSGNVLWRWNGGDSFENVAPQRGLHDCGWSWGSKFVDIDNDGDLDLFVGNGLVTTSNPKSYWYYYSIVEGADEHLVSDSRNWVAFNGKNLAGSQRACFFVNNGHGFFRDVSEQVGLDAYRNDDERGVAVADLENKGHMSVIVSNQKGPLRVYKLNGAAYGQWIGFVLRRRNGVSPSWGTSVVVRTRHGQIFTREVQPLNGYSSQSDERVHVGLGGLQAKDIESVMVVWPGGTRQFLKSFQVGTYNEIQED